MGVGIVSSDDSYLVREMTNPLSDMAGPHPPAIYKGGDNIITVVFEVVIYSILKGGELKSMSYGIIRRKSSNKTKQHKICEWSNSEKIFASDHADMSFAGNGRHRGS